MPLQQFCCHNHLWRNFLIRYIFIQYILAVQFEAFAMSSKLHQKLVEDIRLQKRLLGLIDEQNNVVKERRGSYSYYRQPPPQGIETQQKRFMNLRSGGEDGGDSAYAWDDRRNSSRRGSDGRGTSRSKHELALRPHETPASSKTVQPFPDFPICNQSNNYISEYHRHQQRREEKPKVKVAAIGARFRNANDEGVPGDFIDSMHASYNNSTKFQQNHRRRRSLDLGESNRNLLPDSETVNNNAQARSIVLVSQDARKLGVVLKDKGDVGRDLLKGAMDLEESLRILARFQKATGRVKNVEKRRQSVDLKELLPFSHRVLQQEDNSFERRREPPRLSLDGGEFGKSSNEDLRDAIRASLNRQKKLYAKTSDGGTNDRPSNSISALQQVEHKKRIPNVIARLMGLEEMPSDSHAAPSNRVLGRTDSSMQASRSVERERGSKPRPQESTPLPPQWKDSVQKDVHVKAEEYEDTIQAAFKRMKQQAPPKPSFQEELSQKLKRLHSAETPRQEHKTLKQILETMQVKGLLHQKAEYDHMHKEAAIVLKPVMEVHKPAKKLQELQEKPTSRKPKDKVVAKEISSPSDIVIIKPVNGDVHTPLKATELHSKRSKQENLVKSTEPKKKSKSLSKPADNGQSKKKHSINNPEGTMNRPKQRTRDGDVQKHSKSQPPVVLQELKRRRSERISKANNTKILSKPEKQRPTHSIKAKESVSKPPRPTLRVPPTDRASEATQIHHGLINQNASVKDDNNEATSPNVETLGPASQDENSESESSSASLRHNNNSTEQSMSPVELPAEADALHEEEEETAEEEEEEEDEEEGEDEEEEETSSPPIHSKDSSDSHNKFSEDLGPSNYVNDKEMTPEKMNYKDYVWQILTRNPTFMNIEAAEATELYPRLYFKLQQQEAATMDEDEALERRLVLDCVKELLKRKARLRFQMKQPVRLSRTTSASLGFKRKKSIQDLVLELGDDIAGLMAYHVQQPSHNKVRNDKLGGDFIQSALKKDLDTGNNSIWNPSWDNGVFGEEEGHDIGREVEKLIFDDLLEEVISIMGSDQKHRIQ